MPSATSSGLRVTRRSFIKSVKDLAGKRVGVSAPGSSTHYFLNFLLTKNGLALSVFHRGGAGLASLSLAVAFAGALEPAIIDELFIGLSVAVPVAALALARWGPKPSENT